MIQDPSDEVDKLAEKTESLTGILLMLQKKKGIAKYAFLLIYA